MLKIKEEFKAALVKQPHGPKQIEMLFLDPSEYEYYNKFYPYMFEQEQPQILVKTIPKIKSTTDDSNL
jgi:hypothetical protein